MDQTKNGAPTSFVEQLDGWEKLSSVEQAEIKIGEKVMKLLAFETKSDLRLSAKILANIVGAMAQTIKLELEEEGGNEKGSDAKH